MNLNLQTITRILFLDIETVSEKAEFSQISETFQKLWAKKAISIQKSLEISNKEGIAALYKEKAGIFAEFSKIICISVGYLNSESKLRIKSFSGHDEKAILTSFSKLLEEHYPDPNNCFLCGHNVREFDIPFICRRMVKHQISLPPLLSISGKKPWQTEFIIDTMELWRFGDIKNYTSLELIATTLGIPTPKDDIDGSQVGRVYWEERDLNRIVLYCQKDVVTVVRLVQHLSLMDWIADDQIEFA